MMLRDASVSTPSSLPSIAAYNIRFLSLSPSQEAKWKNKLDNVRHLTKEFTITALLETHVGRAEADLHFCRHVKGTTNYYEHGFAVLVQDDWASAYKPELHVVVPDAIVVLMWEHRDVQHYVFFMRLDAFSESTRRSQLREATQWSANRVRRGDWVCFAGDRNFVCDHTERESSSALPWRPSRLMVDAWDCWLASIGAAEQIPQPEFTWSRITSDQAGRTGWTYEVLDVVGSNAWTGYASEMQGYARRCDDVPFPKASDHYPVGLRWLDPASRGRRRKSSGSRTLKRAIPQWLIACPDFISELDAWVDDWFSDRPASIAGLVSFSDGVHAFASSYLSSRVVLAKTARHKLELALAASKLLKRYPIDETRLARICAADPGLQEIVELEVDVNIPGDVRAHDAVLERLRARCEEQARAAVVEASAATESPACNSADFRGHEQSESILQELKRIKSGKRTSLCELWDEQRQDFTADKDRMAEIIKGSVMERQGSSQAAPFAGQTLLDSWQADFRLCRAGVSLHEIEVIILDGPNGKQPGPDGVPAAILKRYTRRIAGVFHETWEELSAGACPEVVNELLGWKKWVVIPKTDGANTLGKLRDLELGNEVRKVLARVLFKILDEVCQHSERGLTKAQQAFVQGRDIVRNTTMLCRDFMEAKDEAVEGDDPFLLLALDCSKGYNNMDHGWLFRCLEKANVPEAIVNVVKALLVNMPILVLDGIEYGMLQLASGLTQGCPASCMLYIIAVDPLLAALQRVQRRKGVSGFVDDWSIGCKGFGAVVEVAATLYDFERASGQQVNRDKSAAIPARVLTNFEMQILYAAWGGEIRVSYHERVLGVYVGLGVRVEDQYFDALAKFDRTLGMFASVRSSLSLAMRIVVVNVFLWTLFAYLNRHFFMPRKVLQTVENRVLQFLTPVTWSKLGIFTAVGRIYGLRVALADLRLANVASLIATHEAWADIRSGTAASLARWRRRSTQIVNPAFSWKTAFDFFLAATGTTYHTHLHAESRQRARPVRPFRTLYRKMADATLQNWQEYLRSRVEAKGWNGELLVRGLQRLPRSVPQAHRWFLLKLHLNAPLTSARYAAARTVDEAEPCAFCQLPCGDKAAHLLQCPAVLAAYDAVAGMAALPPLADARGPLMMQVDLDGASVAGVVAIFHAVWDIRAMCRRGISYEGHAQLVELIWKSLLCPWLMRCSPTKCRQQRRAERVREPNPVPDTVMYRSDGASRGQGGSEDSVAGWGAAVWRAAPHGQGTGAPLAEARGFLGRNVSNNVAEYHGLLQCMRRAARADDRCVMFEVDSMLLAMQLARYRPWACRSENLLDLHRECVRLGERMAETGVAWNIRHVYREFNQVADSLANRAIDERGTNGYSQAW